jgi:hypothetical protein
VNRAGELWSQQLRTAAVGERLVGDQRAELEEAIAIIDWWRSEHAKPLSRVAANLSHYSAAEGKPIVTQRLKKLQTMIGKLFREPGMKLGRMEDIGGVRAVLPAKMPATALPARSGGIGQSPGFAITLPNRSPMDTERST